MIAPTIIQAADDPALWRNQFRDRRTWVNWFTLVKALFGLPLDASELPLFTDCTGRKKPLAKRAKEGWLIVGRRGGKSRILAFMAAYLAAFVDWTPFMSPGEVGVISVIASNRKQCRAIMSYLTAFLVDHPLLRDRVVSASNEEIELTTGVVIEVVTCSFKSVRGRTIIAALCDEAAFWASEDGSNPASEVIAAIRPGMATIPDALLLVASSPYARRGPLYDAWQRYWGKDHGSVLCWRAPTWVMNPGLPRDSEIISEEFEKDPASANAEYGAEWRDDVAAFIDPNVIHDAVVLGCHEYGPSTSTLYVGFSDAAGGSGGDSFTAAVVHLTPQRRIIVDAIREITPPFSPEAAIVECVRLFKYYGIRRITADRYASQFPVEIYAKHGITCVPSELSKSDIYSEFLPLINSRRVDLLDHQKLVKQLCGLERRTARSGKDSIDHGPGQHDDVANAVCGAVVHASQHRSLIITQEMLQQSRQPPNRSIMSFGRKPPCYF